jgi:hypothetical protein
MPAVLDDVLPLEMVWYECEGGHQGRVSFPFEMILYECESWSPRKCELALGDGTIWMRKLVINERVSLKSAQASNLQWVMYCHLYTVEDTQLPKSLLVFTLFVRVLQRRTYHYHYTRVQTSVGQLLSFDPVINWIIKLVINNLPAGFFLKKNIWYWIFKILLTYRLTWLSSR